MDAELARFVEEAASIVPSGRWDAVNETAMLTLGNSEARKIQRDLVFTNGFLFFGGAFAALENISRSGV